MLAAIGRVCSLRVIGGHLPFLRVKVQWVDFDSFIFTPHSLYHFSRSERCSWMSAEATEGSWLVAIRALSSAKSAMRLVGSVGWS